MTMQPCYRCEETKPLAAFAFRYTRTHKRVRARLCKKCINEGVKLLHRRRTRARWLATLPGRTTVNLMSEAELHGDKLAALVAELDKRKPGLCQAGIKNLRQIGQHQEYRM